MHRLLRLSIAILLTSAPVAARADFTGPLSPGVWMSTMNMDPISETLRQKCMLPEDQPGPRQPDRCRRGNAEGGAPDAAAVASPSLSYLPSPARRKANLAAFVDKSRAADPAAAGQLQSLFASGDIIAKIGQGMAPVGLRVDNLADAYTVWWVNCWSAVHSDYSTPDRATAAAVKAQAARAILAGGKIAGVPDAMKQEFAEALLIQALLLEAALEQAKGNEAQLKAVAVAANAGAKGMGLDLTTMKLTGQGFIAIQ